MAKALKTMVMVMMCLGLLLAAGCSDTGKKNEDESIKVGMFIYRGDDTFISSMVKYMEIYAGMLSEEKNYVVSITVEDAKRNQSAQNKQIENLLMKDFDIVAVNMVDRTMASYIINMAEKYDTPVIFFNREPVESDMELWDRVYYVGADARQSGEMQGQIVLDYIADNMNTDKNGDGKLQYVMLEGEPTHQDSAIRTEVTISTILDGGIELQQLASSTAEWERGIAAAKMQTWLDQYGENIELVLSNNDDMALGAIDALRESNMLSNGPAVFGIDGNDTALIEIKEGNMGGSVVNDSFGQAKAILDLAYVLVEGENPQELVSKIDGQYIYVPYYKVTVENVDDEIERREQLDNAK